VKDFLNRDLALDDFVVFPGPYNGGMKLGKIIKFTPKNVKIEHPGYRRNEMTSTLRESDQCVKVDGTDLTFFLLSRQNQGYQ
jgi:hypothetical protein